MKRNTIIKIIAAVVLIGAIVGVGAFAYRAGMASGIEFDPQQFEDGTYPIVPRMGMGYGYRGFHPCGFLIPLFLFLLVFGTIRTLFWGRPRHWHHMYGYRGMHRGTGYGYCQDNVPPIFDEWHRRAHEQGSKVDPESPDTGEAVPK